MSARRPYTLIGDRIENPANILLLESAAAMFGAPCLYRADARTRRGDAATIRPEAVSSLFDPVIVLDNLAGAESVYGADIDGTAPALVVGNERAGVSHELRSRAQRRVEIPMFAQRLDTLNVACAAAVGLYYLTRGGGAAMQIRTNPGRRRPDLLFADPRDHFEAGSAIRSAGAFGWDRLTLQDLHGVWFGAARAARNQGMAAARRRRNPIRLASLPAGARLAYDEIAVVNLCGRGAPLHKANLARGARQLVVISDDDEFRYDLSHFDGKVSFVHLEVTGPPVLRRFRLIASIVIAEIARQVGQRPRITTQPARRGKPFYDSSLRTLAQEFGELIYLEDLEAY